jgi:hypothetical protein
MTASLGTASFGTALRAGRRSAQRTVVRLDRGLRLQQVALRNAASAVASDRVSARLRADAAAAIAAQEPVRANELTLVGA